MCGRNVSKVATESDDVVHVDSVRSGLLDMTQIQFLFSLIGIVRIRDWKETIEAQVRQARAKSFENLSECDGLLKN